MIYHKSLVTENDPSGGVAEAYRILRTNLYYSNVDKRLKTILITSPSMGDGKSTTAANLAITLAKGNNKTLFMGADLRKPRGRTLFGIKHRWGLSEVISQKVAYGDAIKSYDEVDNLYVFQAGSIPPNPSEMLQSNTMKELIDALKEVYDYIIIDAPPINLVSETLALVGLADGVILAIAENQTKISESKSSVKALKSVGANILGVVITKMKSNKKESYYGYK